MSQPDAASRQAADPTLQGGDDEASTQDLAALVGSRICHDLISPLGAIGNGVELLGLTGGGAGGPEMALITESVENASARIRFFRIAFGAAEPGQTLSRQEIVQVLSDVGRAGKVRVAWRAPGEVQRMDAKLVFLLLMCFESAMPFGGGVEARPERGRWRMLGTADKLRADPEIWSVLSEPVGARAVTPAQVHFALAAQLARRLGRRLGVEIGGSRIEVMF